MRFCKNFKIVVPMKSLFLFTILAIYSFGQVLHPATSYYIPIAVNHEQVALSSSNFLYQIDLSEQLEDDETFRNNITTSGNIAIYDSSDGVGRDRYIDLNLPTNDLIISWNAPVSTSVDRIFYVCVGAGISEVNAASTFTGNGYLLYHSFNEFTAASTTLDRVSGNSYPVQTQANLGNEGILGNCAGNYGQNGYIRSNFQLLSDGEYSFEFLINVNTTGYGTWGRIFENWPNILYTHLNDNITYTSDDMLTPYNIYMSYGSWHYVVINKYYNGVAAAYVDANYWGSAGTGIPATAETYLWLLNNNSETGAANAYNDEFAIHNHEISANYLTTRNNELMGNNFFIIGTGLGILSKPHRRSSFKYWSPRLRDWKRFLTKFEL